LNDPLLVVRSRTRLLAEAGSLSGPFSARDGKNQLLAAATDPNVS
jgi:hypothetical protein